MLDSGVGASLPAAIVVGRTLATIDTSTNPPATSPAYFVGDVKNNQVVITYTAYNEQADPETGVLLTTTLGPGVTIDASTPPSQAADVSGQSLTFSLGTIQGFDRASVTLTLDLAGPSTTQVDTGAQVFATLDAGAVTNSTPAATLRAGSDSDPSLLASTPDANTTDPYIQEEAAKLDYDPTQIFNFLHTQIGYNSYVGSVRGARGTLWSSAGNALDVASLGVALMRASGIPAQYVQGTLSQSLAQQLILTMFPSPNQTLGYVPSGTATSDPANDPTLLSETESHFWFQFDAGNGFKDADPLMPGATVGQTFAPSQGTFATVPDSLREKTEITLSAEFYSSASALFGLGGGGLSTTTVLDQTFNDVDLVGHPLTLGNFVNQSSGGFLFTATTNTYSPYLEVGDLANPDPSQDEVLRGTDYQEVITNFPLGSQILTGLFLDVSLSGPQGPTQTYDRTLLDRIGYAVRQNGGSPSLDITATSPPAVSALDSWSIGVQASEQPAPPLATMQAQVTTDAARLSSIQASANPDSNLAAAALNNTLIDQSRSYLVSLMAVSDGETDRLAATDLLKAYFDRPRVTIVGVNLSPINNTSSQLSFEADLRRDTIRAIAYPGQATSVVAPFQTDRGILESVAEGSVFPATSSDNGLTLQFHANAAAVIGAAAAQNIPLLSLTPADIAQVSGLPISADARARITSALEAGKNVIVPSTTVTLNGLPAIAWFEIDPVSGEAVGVGEDGTHQAAIEWTVIGVATATVAYLTQGPFAAFAAATTFAILKTPYTLALTSAFNKTDGRYNDSYKVAKLTAQSRLVEDVNQAIKDADDMAGLPIFKQAYKDEQVKLLLEFLSASSDHSDYHLHCRPSRRLPSTRHRYMSSTRRFPRTSPRDQYPALRQRRRRSLLRPSWRDGLRPGTAQRKTRSSPARSPRPVRPFETPAAASSAAGRWPWRRATWGRSPSRSPVPANSR